MYGKHIILHQLINTIIMDTSSPALNRRKFIKKASLATVGTIGVTSVTAMYTTPLLSTQEDLINVVGPKNGYAPQIGTLVSMMNWMRSVILNQVQNLDQRQLDFLLDDQANTIGAMLMHLAATERFYQIHTLESKSWGDWSKADKKRWNVASGLGDKARKDIKGQDLNYYLDTLDEVRSHTLKELANRDDEWLLKVDQDWYWGPTNAYCKWFHVVEHESNHNGQIKLIQSRIPNS